MRAFLERVLIFFGNLLHRIAVLVIVKRFLSVAGSGCVSFWLTISPRDGENVLKGRAAEICLKFEICEKVEKNENLRFWKNLKFC